MADSEKPAASPKQGSFGIAWLLVGLAVLAYVMMRSRGPEASGDLVGILLPPLKVEGWLNVQGPVRDESLRGQVVLVDNWASWCGPCRAKMPALVEFNQKFRDQGLVVIGLTPEGGQELGDVETYVKSVEGLDWPIGFGANLPIDVMGVTAFPTLILFDKSGTSIWAGHGMGGLEAAVVKALAAPG
jgi:thiol-disulfide isomerase/thioredoxin